MNADHDQHDSTGDPAMKRPEGTYRGPGPVQQGYRPADPDAYPTILQILPAMGGSGGVERGAVEMAGAIIEAGGRAIVASEGGIQTHELKRVRADHVTLPVASKNPVVMYRNIARIAEVIRHHKVDIVHVRSRAPAWSAYFACKRTKKPMLTTFHGTYSTSNFLKRGYNAIMTKGERVIAISEFIAGHLRRRYGVPIEKIRVIHRGVDIDKFDADRVSAERVIKCSIDWRIPDGIPIVMMPGRLTRWKGQLVLIEALARLGHKNIRCLLVGSAQGRDAYRKVIERRVEAHGLEEVVRIIDHCDDMPAAYMLTDLVISASTDPEAFGRVVAEAQAMGRPVIATDHGGARETVKVGETGWLIEPGDIDQLTGALADGIAMDEKTRNQMAQAAVEHVRANFTKSQMTEKTLDVYNEILTEWATKHPS